MAEQSVRCIRVYFKYLYPISDAGFYANLVRDYFVAYVITLLCIYLHCETSEVNLFCYYCILLQPAVACLF